MMVFERLPLLVFVQDVFFFARELNCAKVVPRAMDVAAEYTIWRDRIGSGTQVSEKAFWR
jgi:hypothetical protein